MSIASNLWQRLGGAPDPRSDREIGDDIEAEFAFHLEQRERDLVARGLSLEEAHTEAARRFGNIDKVRAECRRVQLGGRIMLQRITIVVLIVLLAAAVVLGWRSVTAQQHASEDMAAMRAEISNLAKTLAEAKQRVPAANGMSVSPAENERQKIEGSIKRYLSNQQIVQNRREKAQEETSPEVWRERFRENASSTDKSRELLLQLRQECSQDRALKMLAASWDGLTLEQRHCALDVLTEESSEQLARTAVHMGATDLDARVADHAFLKLRELTLLRFDVAHRVDYLAWQEANKDIGLYEIVEKSVPALVKELTDLGKWNEICALYSPLVPHPYMAGAAALPACLLESGALDLIKLWARDPDPKARVAAVQWLAAAKVDEVTARMIVLPILADPAPRDPALLPAVCEALVTLDCTWRSAPLLDELAKVMRKNQLERAELQPIALALGKFSDREREAQAEVPTILAWICRANSPLANEVLGDPALLELTGVAYDPTHDAAWWLNWWSINRANYPNAAGSENGLPHVE